MKVSNLFDVHKRTAFLSASSSGVEDSMPFCMTRVKTLYKANMAFNVTSASAAVDTVLRRSAIGLREALLESASVMRFSRSATALSVCVLFVA